MHAMRSNSFRKALRRRGPLLVLLVLVMFPATSPAVVIPENLNAFQGYVLETPVSQYPSLKLIKNWSTDFVEVSLYENPEEQLTLNGVTFKQARYRFADGQLESIQLSYEGRENRDKLLQWLEEHYAKITPAERRMIPQVEWHGDKLSVTLSYEYSSKQGHLWFISPALQHKVNQTKFSPTP